MKIFTAHLDDCIWRIKVNISTSPGTPITTHFEFDEDFNPLFEGREEYATYVKKQRLRIITGEFPEFLDGDVRTIGDGMEVYWHDTGWKKMKVIGL